MRRSALSCEDQVHLQELEPKLNLIRDRVRGVAASIHTGLYLWGDGGTSKSYTILDELQKLKADYVMHNSRMTGRGLVETLRRFSASIHVIEDCESIFDDKRAWGVLRSALWSQSKNGPWSGKSPGLLIARTSGSCLPVELFSSPTER
jgi:hypothetical protein